MKRKLFALLLSGLAAVLLMGAGVEDAKITFRQNSVVLGREADTAVDDGLLLGRETDEGKDPVLEVDNSILVDGNPAPKSVGKTIYNGVSYVSLAEMAVVLEPSAQVVWEEAEQRMTISTEKLTITAHVGYSFVEANGRYLHVPNRVQREGEQMIVPLKVVTEAFDAQITWDEATQTIHITKGSGALESGETYYNQNDLFWLSRLIFAESGGQEMKGMIAVGNVVLNRVKSDIFPDTLLGVISQRNQFSTYKGGKLANRVPSDRSIIAAKIVLDGGVVEEVKDAYFFDSAKESWASRNKNCVAVIGGHRFFDY